MRDEQSKVCSKCKLEKPLTAYGLQTRGKFGRLSACYTCYADATRRYRAAHPEKAKATTLHNHRVSGWTSALVTSARSRSKQTGMDFDLDSEFVASLYAQQNGRCHWLKVPLIPSIERRHPLRPSLDRLDPDKGYTRDNVVLACHFANLGRSDMSADQFSDFLKCHLLVDTDELLAASVAA